MSLNGKIWLELARKKIEEIRIGQVRERCRQIQQDCLAELAQAREPAVQQYAREGLARVQERLGGLAAGMGAEPDQDLKALKRIQKDLNAVLVKARASANNWNRQQMESQEALARARQAVAVGAKGAGRAAEDLAAKANAALIKAFALHDRKQYKEVLSLCQEIEDLTEKGRQAALDETVRRTVVRGLLQTLQGMGFVVEGPQLQGGGPDGGTVTLAGKLPSGRQARFQVRLDGQMDFDLDGYEGRTCGKQMEAVTPDASGPVRRQGWSAPDHLEEPGPHLQGRPEQPGGRPLADDPLNKETEKWAT